MGNAKSDSGALLEAGRDAWPQRADAQQPTPSLTRGSGRLYSYTDPATESRVWVRHLSPRAIRARLLHATRRDRIYRDAGGAVKFPAVELELTQAEAVQLTAALEPLSPRSLRDISPAVRTVVIALATLVGFIRGLLGDKVVAQFSSPDRMWYGSIYSTRGHHFVNLHARSKEALEAGLRKVTSSLQSGAPQDDATGIPGRPDGH